MILLESYNDTTNIFILLEYYHNDTTNIFILLESYHNDNTNIFILLESYHNDNTNIFILLESDHNDTNIFILLESYHNDTTNIFILLESYHNDNINIFILLESHCYCWTNSVDTPVIIDVSIASGMDVTYQFDYDDGAGRTSNNVTNMLSRTYSVPGEYNIHVFANDVNQTFQVRLTSIFTPIPTIRL